MSKSTNKPLLVTWPYIPDFTNTGNANDKIAKLAASINTAVQQVHTVASSAAAGVATIAAASGTPVTPVVPEKKQEWDQDSILVDKDVVQVNVISPLKATEVAPGKVKLSYVPPPPVVSTKNQQMPATYGCWCVFDYAPWQTITTHSELRLEMKLATIMNVPGIVFWADGGGGPSINSFFFLEAGATTWKANLSGGSEVTFPAPALGMPHVIVVEYVQAGVDLWSIWVDGVQQTLQHTISGSASLFPSCANISIGAQIWNGVMTLPAMHFMGVINRTRIFTKVTGLPDIPPPYATLIADWRAENFQQSGYLENLTYDMLNAGVLGGTQNPWIVSSIGNALDNGAIYDLFTHQHRVLSHAPILANGAFPWYQSYALFQWPDSTGYSFYYQPNGNALRSLLGSSAPEPM